MLSRFVQLAAVLLTSFWVCAAANATTVSRVGEDASGLPPIPVDDNFPPSFITLGTIYDHVTPPPDSSPSTYRSPYQNVDESMPAAYVGQPYSSVRNGSVGYNFANGGVSLSLLWGSPDSYNTLKFFDGLNGSGALLGSFSLVDLLSATAGLGHDYVTFLASGGVFCRWS